MRLKSILLVLIVFLCGTAVGSFPSDSMNGWSHEKKESTSKQIRQASNYKYINPLLECEVAEGSIDARKENFYDDLEKFVAELQVKNSLTDVAIYFRDLNNGPTFGIGERGEFLPASLLKVPVMMAYYRWSEEELGLLQKEIFYAAPQDFGVRATIVPHEELVPGRSYTVEELIRQMVVYSDNQALGLLSSRLSAERIKDLFSMLGVGEDVVTDPEGRLTVREYAAFFRILFNSSYLSRENSEKALALLSSTDFDEGIVSSLPVGISVAHKFGEAGTGDVERQLHDCGIVYFPDHPYLTCIMTRGHDTDSLKKSISEISKFIYDKIDEQY